MKTLIRTAGAASLLALGAASANAAPLSQLYFTQNAGFLDPVVEFNAGALQPGDFGASAGPDAPDDTYLSFDWYGTDSNVRSSIAIQSYTDATSPDTEVPGGATLKLDSSFAAADATADEWNMGDWWVLDTLTQTNRTLTSLGGTIADPLWILDTFANLRIFADEDHNELLFADLNSQTRISFTETLNTDDIGGCDTNNTGGADPCEDVFTVLAAELDPISFNHNGYKYNINFALLPGVSTNADGDVASSQSVVKTNPDGSISVYTPELNPGTSSIHVLAQYTATQIPEPAILGLFSIGMLGLGFAARRRRQA